MMEEKRATSCCIVIMLLSIILSVQDPTVTSLSWNPTVSEGARKETAVDPIEDLQKLNGKYHLIENAGQWENDALFIGRTSFGHIALKHESYLYHVKGSDTEYVIEVSFADCNKILPKGTQRYDMNVNFIRMRDEPVCYQPKVFNEVMYENIWNDIDIRFYFQDGHLKYDMIVNPGGDPSDIRFDIDGVDDLMISRDTLGITVDRRFILHDKIIRSYQPGSNLEPECRFRRIGVNGISLFTSDYDENRLLVVDPLVFSTYVGGAKKDRGEAMDVDESGNIYFTGDTESYDFPFTSGAYSTSKNGQTDAYITKMNASGTRIDFSTYIGGTNDDYGKDIALDSNNNMVITGNTQSGDFPVTSGCYDSELGNGSTTVGDAFVLSLNRSGSSLEGSTYIGGYLGEEVEALTLDENDNIYITGNTMSSDFPIADGDLNSSLSDFWGDAFILKLNKSCTEIIFSTLIGGSETDSGNAIFVCNHEVFITGNTASSDFPITSGAFDTSKNSASWTFDIFVLKLNITENKIEFSTYLGGSDGGQQGLALTVDDDNNVYITGFSAASDFPMSDNAYNKSHNGKREHDIILTILNSSGDKIIYSTYIGGIGTEFANDIKLDKNNNVYLTGNTYSVDFPVMESCFDTTFAGSQSGEPDCFLFIFNRSLVVQYSTYIGGLNYDSGRELHPYNSEVIIVGSTKSDDFPTTYDCFDNSSNGDTDAFLLRLNLTLRCTPPRNLTYEMGNGYVQLNWDEPEDEGGSLTTDYKVYRGLTEGNEELIGSLGDVLEFNDTTVKKGVNYWYYVTASNPAGESDPSNRVHAVDNETPVVVEIEPISNCTTGDACEFLISVRDNVEVFGVNLSYRIDTDTARKVMMNTTDHERWNTTIIVEHRLGMLHYNFSVVDWSGNRINSSDLSIPVIDNDVPDLFDDNTVSEIGTQSSLLFNVQASDNIEVSAVVVHYKRTGEEQYDPVSLDDYGDRWRGEHIVEDSIETMEYYFTAFDSSGNTNETKVREILVYDPIHPIFDSELTETDPTTGDLHEVKVRIRDNVEVREAYIFYSIDNGPPVNATMSAGEGYWSFDIAIPDSARRLYYRFEFADTSNNWGKTEVFERDVVDNDPPVILEDLTYERGTTGDDLCFMLNISENIEVDHVMVYCRFGDGEPEPIELYGYHLYSSWIVIPPDSLEPLHYRAVVTDLEGNTAELEERTIAVIDNDEPVILSIDDNGPTLGTGDELLISVECSDNIGIDSVTAEIWVGENDVPVNIELAPGENSFSTKYMVSENSVEDIIYLILVTDHSGLQARSRNRTISVKDTIDPTINKIENLTLEVGVRFDIAADAYDNIGIVEYLWEGFPHSYEGSSISDYLNESGNYSIKVTVKDGAGNSNHTTFTITVLPEGSQPPQNGTDHSEKGIWVWVVIVIISLIIISGIVAYITVRGMKKGSGRKAEGPDPHPEEEDRTVNTGSDSSTQNNTASDSSLSYHETGRSP